MRLVDVDVAIEGVKELFSAGDCFCDEYSIVGMLNSLPSRQLPETYQAKWLEFFDGIRIDYICSKCGRLSYLKENFCPECGANMRYKRQKAVGRWIEHKWAEECDGLLISNYECSECSTWERKETDFCPNCGADMRGERDETG